MGGNWTGQEMVPASRSDLSGRSVVATVIGIIITVITISVIRITHIARCFTTKTARAWAVRRSSSPSGSNIKHHHAHHTHHHIASFSSQPLMEPVDMAVFTTTYYSMPVGGFPVRVLLVDAPPIGPQADLSADLSADLPAVQHHLSS